MHVSLLPLFFAPVAFERSEVKESNRYNENATRGLGNTFLDLSITTRIIVIFAVGSGLFFGMGRSLDCFEGVSARSEVL